MMNLRFPPSWALILNSECAVLPDPQKKSITISSSLGESDVEMEKSCVNKLIGLGNGNMALGNNC